MAGHRIGKTEARLVQFAQGFSFGADLIKEAGEFLFVQVAQLQTENDLAGNHVVSAGLDLDPSDGADLPAGHAGHNLVYLLDEARGGKQRVAALVHGRGAGVVGKAFNRDIGMQNADNPFHHANVDLLALERSALLDVQLKVTGNAARPALQGRKPIRIAADNPRAFANGLAALRYQVQPLLIQSFPQRLAADGPAFFILENDDLERVAQRDLLFLERLRDFNRGERTDIAIVIAAHRDGIDVRANQQRLERGIAAGARADDISGKVNMDVQARGLHHADGILPALQIGLRVRCATHATLRVGSELRELFQMFKDALAIHAGRRLRGSGERKHQGK